MVNREKSRFSACLMLAFISSFAFLIENDIYIAPQEISSKIEVTLWQIKMAVKEPNYIALALIPALFFAYYFLWKKINWKILKVSIPFAVISALILMLCESYYQYDSWDKVFGGQSVVLLAVIRGCGIAVLFFFSFQVINSLQLEVFPLEFLDKKKCKEFICILFLFMVCWLPYIIIMYPGIICPDTADEVAQVLGNIDYCWTIKTISPEYQDSLWNNHHPVFYTLILSIFVKLGDVLGSHNVGFFVFSIIQSGCLAWVLAYFMIFIKKMGVALKIRKGILLFFAFNPLFPLWGITFSKDILFSAATLMVILLLYQFLKNPVRLIQKFELVFWCLLMMLLRNNGFYMLLLVIPLGIGVLRKDKRKLRELLAAVLISMIFFQVGVQGLLFPVFHISQGSVREMLSVPFVQTARYVKEYGDTLDAEDENNILTLFSREDNTLKDIVRNYVPDQADKVKDRFNPGATKTDLRNYFKTWGKGFLKHPEIYIEAFFNLNYGWFNFDNKQRLHHYTGIAGKNITKMLEDVQSPDALAGAQRSLTEYVEIVTRLPFTTWMIEYSFYTWAYVIFLMVMIIRKKYQELLTCCILYANYFIGFLGPVSYTRYALPMIICAPFIMILTFMTEGKREV